MQSHNIYVHEEYPKLKPLFRKFYPQSTPTSHPQVRFRSESNNNFIHLSRHPTRSINQSISALCEFSAKKITPLVYPSNLSYEHITWGIKIKSMWIEIPILYPLRLHKALSLRKYIARFWLPHGKSFVDTTTFESCCHALGKYFLVKNFKFYSRSWPILAKFSIEHHFLLFHRHIIF